MEQVACKSKVRDIDQTLTCRLAHPHPDDLHEAYTSSGYLSKWDDSLPIRLLLPNAKFKFISHYRGTDRLIYGRVNGPDEKLFGVVSARTSIGRLYFRDDFRVIAR